MGHIDVHHHLAPPVWLQRAHEGIRAGTRNWSVPYEWSASRSIEEMDANCVATAILSLGTPGLEGFKAQECGYLARQCNEFAVTTARAYPGRFGCFAVLPMPYIDLALQEIAHAFDELRVDGVGLMTSFDGRWPGDPSFEPVFEELDRRSAVVYFHPTIPAQLRNAPTGLPPAWLEFPFDTARAIMSLLNAGYLSRFIQIRWIFSHSGGALPALAGRIAALADGTPSFRQKNAEGTIAELKNLYFDVAGSANPYALDPLLRLIPQTQILFGSDYPYLRTADTIRDVHTVFKTADASQQIFTINAERLWPHLSSTFSQ